MITSKNNDFIKKCINLKSKKHSKQYNLCFVESYKLVKELHELKLVDQIILSESKIEFKNEFKNIVIEIVSESIAKYLSDAVTTDGVFAICKIPNNTEISFKKCLVLDRIQDPSNLGAIIRSACAFGFNTIFMINSVYPYSYKSIRSSMGQIFKVNLLDITTQELIEIKSKHNINFYVADMDGENLDNISLISGKNYAIIIGNEGQEPMNTVIRARTRKVVCTQVPRMVSAPTR